MNSRANAKLSMFNVVISTCNKNTTIIDTIPAFKQALANFQSIFNDIGEVNERLAVSGHGVTIKKKKQRAEMVRQTMLFASALSALATSTGNNNLKAQADYTTTHLMRLRDESVFAACQQIHNTAAPLLADLADYNLTTTELASLQTAINNFNAVKSQPRTEITNKKVLGVKLTKQIARATDLLTNQLDKTAVGFKTNNSNFYNTYINARTIYDAHQTTTTFDCHITSSATGEPIPSAQLHIEDLKLTFTADENGYIHIKPAKPGIHNLHISAAGFQPKEYNKIKFKLGGHTRSQFTLDAE